MTRKFSRNYSLRVVPFFAALIALVGMAALGQVPGAGQLSASTQRHTEARAQTLGHPLSPGDTALFMPPIFYYGGGYGVASAAIADVNGDGKPDLVVANSYCANGVGVLLGNGDGTFQPAVTFVGCALENTIDITIGDLNGDSKPDIVLTGGAGGGKVLVLLGNGDGTFQAPVALDTGSKPTPHLVVIADVNGDGKPDLVVAKWHNPPNATLGVLLGNGDGTFEEAEDCCWGYDVISVAVTDVNGDGTPDIIFTTGSPFSPVALGVLLGNGDGTFQPPVTYPGQISEEPLWVAVADVNGDGKPDMVVSNWTPGTVAVLLGNGDGTFRAPVTYPSGGSNPRGIAVEDVNGDGKLDVLVADPSGSVGVLLGNGDGTFQAGVAYASGFLSSEVTAVDVDADGKPDLLAIDTYFCANCLEGGVALLLSGTGPRSATTTSLTSSANPAARRQTVTYTATVSSESGGAATGSVAILDGSSTVAIVGLVRNQAQWSTAYSRKGNHAMTAQYPGDADNAGSKSSPLTERIAALPVTSKTRVATSRSPSHVGQAVTFTATVTSTYGAIPDGELVTFYEKDTEMGTGTTVGGVATFTTTFYSPGGYRILAVYAGDAVFATSKGKVMQRVLK